MRIKSWATTEGIEVRTATVWAESIIVICGLLAAPLPSALFFYHSLDITHSTSHIQHHTPNITHPTSLKITHSTSHTQHYTTDITHSTSHTQHYTPNITHPTSHTLNIIHSTSHTPISHTQHHTTDITHLTHSSHTCVIDMKGTNLLRRTFRNKKEESEGLWGSTHPELFVFVDRAQNVQPTKWDAGKRL